MFPLIWNPLYLISPQATKSQLEWSQLKFYKVWNKKRSVKKRKTSNNRSRVFEIALEGWREWKGGGNGNFSWESFNHSMLKATFRKHWLVKLARHVCTYSLKFKIWYSRNDCSYKWRLHRMITWKLLFDGEEMKLLTAKDLNLLRGIFLMGEMSKFLAIG